MVDREPGSSEPSLELPKLSWRRRRRAELPADPQAGTVPADTEPIEAAPVDTVPVDEVVVEQPAAAPPPPAAAPAPAPTPPPPAPELAEAPVPDGSDTVVEDPIGEPAEDVPEPAPRSHPIKIHVRRPGGMLAAVVTGLIVGLGIVGLTWASLQGCDSVQGTSSCGKTGYPLLIVILLVMVLIGALLLRLARVGDPGSTSFLAVGLASVLALLFLIDSLDSHWMILVIPVITAACYALAHWVTRTFIEPAAR